jgi:hypothetical protein
VPSPRATVNSPNNLAHCFSCCENFNNIELTIIASHEFLTAVEILKIWLEEYERDLKRKNPETQPVAN